MNNLKKVHLHLIFEGQVSFLEDGKSDLFEVKGPGPRYSQYAKPEGFFKDNN
jgi:hypothetical protein